MKRWGTMAVVTVASLGLVAPAAVRADVLGYTFSMPVKQGVISGLDISDAGTLQMGNVNNKGQFCMDFSSGNQGGEREYLWNGTKLIKVADEMLDTVLNLRR